MKGDPMKGDPMKGDPMKGDVKKKVSPLPSERPWLLPLASSPAQVLEGFWFWWHPGVFEANSACWFPHDGFMNVMVRRLRLPEATQANGRVG